MTGPSARDLMTAEVVTVPPGMPVDEVARLLAGRGITAAPVVEGDSVVLGLVTAADLTCRLSTPAGELSWLGRLLADPARAAGRYARAHGFTAADVMQTEIDAVGPDTTAAEIAAMLERKGIRRVLVTMTGRLLGIISRSDLLRAVTVAKTEPADLPDARIRSAILAAMHHETWADTFHTLVDVRGGIVVFHGHARGPEVQRALRVLAEQVPGVKGVRDLTAPFLPCDQVLL